MAKIKKPALTVPADSLKKFFKTDMTFRQKGETVIAIPSLMEQEVAQVESCLHVVAAGCAAGAFKGKDFVPDADMALSLAFEKESMQSVEVDRQTALAFLHRDAIVLPSSVDRGYVLICYDSVPLGFVKNLGNRCNNLHPQSRRIRMDIR